MPKTDLPKSALNFSENLQIDLDDSDGIKRASMLGYSGKPMEHPWFGQLIVDVEGITFRSSKIPILEDHDKEKKIGFSKKPSTENFQVYFDDITLLDNPLADQFYRNAIQGFPYQASISFYPKKLEELEKGVEAEVNGYKVKGPGIIFRESVFRESSVVTFGMDHRTNSKAFSDEEMVSVNLSEADAEIINKLIPKKEQDMTKEFEEKITELQQKVADYEAQFSRTESENEELKKSILELQKETTKKDLTAIAGNEESEFLMQFYGTVTVDDLTALANKMAHYQSIINELGNKKGSNEVPEPTKEPSVKEIQEYAKKHGMSFLEANSELYKKRS
jgi:hypothetical protein